MSDNNPHSICNHTKKSIEKLFKGIKKHSFCEKCGAIIFRDLKGNLHFTIKPKSKQKTVDFDPSQLINEMIKQQSVHYPNINNNFNMSEEEKKNIDNLNKSISVYLEKRKTILYYLQKITKALNYSDLIFYQCLFYIDCYFSHNFTEDFHEKKLLYYLVGFFLITSKMKENDIFEPTFDTFRCIKKNITLHEEKIGLYEVKCLKIIKYNIFAYSTYDWLNMFIALGFVFDSEINLMNEHEEHKLIKTIYKSVMKILINITTKNIFFKYSPMYISLSIIQIIREKYLKEHNDKSLYTTYLSLFNININDYQQCYIEINNELNPSNSNNILEKKESGPIPENEIKNIIISDEDKKDKEKIEDKKNKYKSTKMIKCMDTRKNKSHLVILCNKGPNFSNQNLPNLVPLFNENKNENNENNENKNNLLMSQNMNSPENESTNDPQILEKEKSSHTNNFKENINSKSHSKKNQSVGLGKYKIQQNSDKNNIRNNIQSSNLIDYLDHKDVGKSVNFVESNKKIKIDASTNNMLNSQNANKNDSIEPIKVRGRANTRYVKSKSKFLKNTSKKKGAGKSAIKSSSHINKMSNFDVNGINNITFNG